MTRVRLVFLFVVVILVTIVPAVIHGRMSRRWGVSEDTTAAARRLEALPNDFADWKLTESSDLPAESLDMLQSFGHINRLYIQRSTGHVASVFVLIGPCKPTAEHSPGVCYSSRDYTIMQQPQKTSIPVEGHAADEFWTMTFRSKRLDGGLQRVYYAWSDGRHWRAEAEPQYAYPGRPYLYKIQVAAQLPPNTVLDKEDFVRSFLNDFLPFFQDYLVPPPE